MSKLLNCIKNPKNAAKVLLKKCGFIPDKTFIRLQYFLYMGKRINLTTPNTLSEKLNWLKLYYHNPLLHKLVDKADVKDYVTEKIGKEYVIPTIGLWNSVNEIDCDKLPNQFVLKCTHDSGSVIICKDINTFNLESAKLKLQSGMNRNYFKGNREWAYKDLIPKIICEPYTILYK